MQPSINTEYEASLAARMEPFIDDMDVDRLHSQLLNDTEQTL